MDEFLDEIKQVVEDPDRTRLRERISRSFPDAKTRSTRTLVRSRSEISDFLRVTLCLPRWPSIGPYSTYRRADMLLAEVMIGVERTLDLDEANNDMTIYAIAKAIGSRLGDQGRRLPNILGLAWSCYKSMSQVPKQLIPALEIYAQRA